MPIAQSGYLVMTEWGGLSSLVDTEFAVAVFVVLVTVDDSSSVDDSAGAKWVTHESVLGEEESSSSNSVSTSGTSVVLYRVTAVANSKE